MLKLERQKGREIQVMSLVIFVDSIFFMTLTPLLPKLASEAHFSKAVAGVLTAAFPTGMLLGAVPGGIFAVRFGPRLAVCGGLALMGIASLAFGYAEVAWLMVLARFAQGIGSASTWAGALGWVVSSTEASRRGAAIGAATGLAVAGSLCGPGVGALAAAFGRQVVFTAMLLAAVALIWWVARLDRVEGASDQGLREIAQTLRRPAVKWSMWVMSLPALISAALQVLGPLRLHYLGVGAGGIAATFLVAAGIEAAVIAPAGRLSDRRGRLLPTQAGLGVAAVLLAAFTLPRSSIVLSVVMIATLGVLGMLWAPAMAMLADASDAAGLNQAFGMSLSNLAWSVGAVGGALLSGAIANAAGDAAPLLLIGGLGLATIAVSVVRPSLTPVPAMGGDDG